MGSVVSARKDIETQIDSEFKSIRKYCDEVYGEVTVIEDRQSRIQYALIQLIVDDPQRYETQLKYKQLNSHENILKLHKYYSVREDICALSKKFWLIIQYHQNSLAREIAQRQESQNYFKKNDLLSLYYQLSLIVLHFSKQPTKLTISNQLIVITKRFWLKVLEEDFHQRRDRLFYELPINDDNDRQYCYLAPEELETLATRQIGKAQKLHTLDSSRVFTLGMCYLEQAILQDCSELYNFQDWSLNFDKLYEFLQFTRNIYGEDIEKLLRMMLKVDPQERISLQELHNFIDKEGEQLSSISPHAVSRVSVPLQLDPPRKASLPINTTRPAVRF